MQRRELQAVGGPLGSLGDRLLVLGVAGFDYLSSAEVAAEARSAADGRAVTPAVEAKLTLAGAGETGLTRIAEVPIYASDAIVRRAASLQATPLAATAEVRMNAAEAARLGLDAGRRVQLVQGAGGTAGLPVTIMGHSLGAALATLCFADVHKNKLLAQEFQGLFAASPRVGNPAFSNSFLNMKRPWWRVTNDSDMVTQIPFPVMSSSIVYQHVGQQISPNVRWFNTNLGSLGKNHTVAYMMYAGITDAKEKDL